MSQSLRQSELFAGNDWRVLYRAFTQINFNASDPTTISQALRDYIRNYYPEDFNDWIESSEFVVLIDLLAYLSGVLAFKTDINARENFLEVAEARESILRLARFLSYTPRRNQAARGMLKLVCVSTNDDVMDSDNNNLNGTTVYWDDPDDPDWFERFTLVLNASFVLSHPFGMPVRPGTVGGTRTELYRVNGRVGDAGLGFSTTVAGQSMTFEVVNGDFEDNGAFFERTPNPDGAFHFYYRNDGNGNGSPGTGFFVLFKQGATQTEELSVANPIENLVIDLAGGNINETDVWVQSLAPDNSVASTWTKVAAIFSQNISYTTADMAVRDIFSVITRDGDAASLRFSDGRFGAVPIGPLRVTYRSSNGLSYTIRPQDIDRIQIALPYRNRRGLPRTLTLTLSLQDSVSNAVPRETDEQIRQRAPGVYAAQNRMVTGEDYNLFPLQGNLAVKLKAINRVYSGHSRHLDLNDPTSTYSDTSVFADDGMFYAEDCPGYAEVTRSANRTPTEIIDGTIAPLLAASGTVNALRADFMDRVRAGRIPVPGDLAWTQASGAAFSSTGCFSAGSPLIQPGALLRVLAAGRAFWVAVTAVSGSVTQAPSDNRAGPVTLAEAVPTGAVVDAILPRYRTTLPAGIQADAAGFLQTNRSFVLVYDYADAEAPWSARAPAAALAASALVVLTADYATGGVWRFTAPGLRYVFESVDTIQWYFDGRKVVDAATGQTRTDSVRILKTNVDANATVGGLPARLGFAEDLWLDIDRMHHYADGYAEPRRILVTFADSDADGHPDDPEIFARVIDQSHPARHTLFWQRRTDAGDPVGALVPVDPTGERTMRVLVFESEADRLANPILSANDVAFQIGSAVAARRNSFWTLDASGWVDASRRFKSARGRGPNVASFWYPADGSPPLIPAGSTLDFHWKHYAPSDTRIDPARTNVIDLFVLTTDYDTATRQWIADGCPADAVPPPPSETELRVAYAEYEDYKMFSDSLVWRPAKYKFLFGTGAMDALRAQLKVVKVASSTLSDGELKSRVVKAVNAYFDVTRWDFGAVFYFTELAAYLHQRLPGDLASVVLVPLDPGLSFGDGFEVRCRSDELFLSTAQVGDVVVIGANTTSNLKIR